MAVRTLVLSPGQCAILPKGATITALLIDGAAAATSTCDNLPAPSDYVCWEFFWQHISSDMGDAIFESLIIGDNTYTVPVSYNAYNSFVGLFSDETLIGQWIAADSALEGLVLFGCDSSVDFSEYHVKIKVPPGITPKLKIKNPAPGGDTFFTLEATLNGDCDDCTGGG